jgi:hypothetical protein
MGQSATMATSDTSLVRLFPVFLLALPCVFPLRKRSHNITVVRAAPHASIGVVELGSGAIRTERRRRRRGTVGGGVLAGQVKGGNSESKAGQLLTQGNQAMNRHSFCSCRVVIVESVRGIGLPGTAGNASADAA